MSFYDIPSKEQVHVLHHEPPAMKESTTSDDEEIHRRFVLLETSISKLSENCSDADSSCLAACSELKVIRSKADHIETQILSHKKLLNEAKTQGNNTEDMIIKIQKNINDHEKLLSEAKIQGGKTEDMLLKIQKNISERFNNYEQRILSLEMKFLEMENNLKYGMKNMVNNVHNHVVERIDEVEIKLQDELINFSKIFLRKDGKNYVTKRKKPRSLPKFLELLTIVDYIGNINRELNEPMSLVGDSKKGV
jgi:chromosome segregation ATPase